MSRSQLLIAFSALCVLLIAAGVPVSGVLSGARPAPTSTPSPTPTATTTPRPSATPTDVPTATTTPTTTILPTATASPTPRPTATATSAPLTASGYWHTDGSRIVDAAGNTVHIAAVNWFGMENVFYVPAGLDKRPLDAIMSEVQALGFNTIRLPFSNQLVEQNPIVRAHLDANPALKGMHALQLLDRIVADAARHHIRIILDNGRSDAGTAPQENGLWYTSRYPEAAWIRDWVTLTRRYAGNPTVVGVDLRNEPHTAGPGPWSVKTYLRQGATWGPYAGADNPATDWRLAAQRAGNAVLAENPKLLIVVEGLQLYPDSTQPSGVDTYWWGGVLQPASLYPVQLAVPNQLVYSPHEYGPYKARMRFFSRAMTYKSLSAVWDKHWGFLDHPAVGPAVPIFIGEFGTCGRTNCVSDETPGSTGQWFGFFRQYLRAHPAIGWAFWALNGTNQRGADCPNYILTHDWTRVRLPTLLNALRGIGLHPGRSTG